MKLPDALTRLLREVPALSRAYLVGGCVRDSLLGINHKDFDLEVYGVDYEQLEHALSPHGRVDLVGKSFGVIKFNGQSGGQWDFSLPRRDSKISTGHKGFEVEFEPDIEPRLAASRRDFTINALMFDPRTGEYFKIRAERQYLVRNLIYPTSDPRLPFLGLHFTRLIHGGIEAGPNAVLAFAREGQHRVGPCFNAAVDQPREVEAQEGKARVGCRVNEVAHQVLTLRANLKVFAAEGHDARVAPLAGQLRYPVAVKSGAVDDVVGRELARRGLRRPARAGVPQSLHARPRDHARAVLRQAFDQIGRASCRE